LKAWTTQHLPTAGGAAGQEYDAGAVDKQGCPPHALPPSAAKEEFYKLSRFNPINPNQPAPQLAFASGSYLNWKILLQQKTGAKEDNIQCSNPG
jgi:hypothetical protein